MALMLSLVFVSVTAVVLSGVTAWYHGSQRIHRMQLKAFSASLEAERNLNEAHESHIIAIKDVVAVQEKQIKHKDAVIQGLEAEVKALKNPQSVLRPASTKKADPKPPPPTKSQLEAAKRGLGQIVKDLSV